MSGKSHERIVDLLPEYALGVLRGAELRRVERHLARCATCRSEVAPWQEVADQLACVPRPVQPPAALKDRMLSSLPGAAQPAGARGTPPRFRYGWAALAIAALCASAAANVALLRRVRAAETKYAEAVTVQMIATDAAAGAAGRLVPSLDGRHGTLSVQGLPGLPPGSQYQLWLVGDSGRTSGGVFSVDGAGCGVLRVSSPAELRAYTAFGVTVEPAGGSPGPTGPRVLGGRR